MDSVLGQLQKILTQEAEEFIFIPAFEKFPIDRIIVLLGVDDKQRERNLEICEYGQFINFGESIEKNVSYLKRFQFKIILPFKVEDLANNDLSALIHFINQSNSFPGFQFDELNEEVSFRYIWIIPSDNLNGILIKNLLQCIRLNLTLFSDLIEKVATGKSSFNDTLSSFIKKFE